MARKQKVEIPIADDIGNVFLEAYGVPTTPSPLDRALANIEDEAVALVVRDLLFDLKGRSGYGLPAMECTLREMVQTWAAIVEGLDMRRAQIAGTASSSTQGPK